MIIKLLIIVITGEDKVILWCFAPTRDCVAGVQHRSRASIAVVIV